MTRILHGKVRGRSIEVYEDLGLGEGQDVEIEVRKVATATRTPGEGLLRTEGALAGDLEWDGIMEEIHQNRKVERGRPVPDFEEP